VVADAGGRQLASRLALEDDGIGILIEEEGEYPIYIDPIVCEPGWTAEGGQEDARFGHSVAVADVTGDGHCDVIVGAPRYDNGETDEGAVFFYYGTEMGPLDVPGWWTDGNQVEALFGWSIAAGGDINNDGCSELIIGAPQYDRGQTDEGAVFLYWGDGGGPLGPPQEVDIDQAFAYFGWSVAFSGRVNGDTRDDVIVGAKFYETGEPFTGEGAAFHYLTPFGRLEEPYEWVAYGGQQGARFGYSVAGAGDVDNDGYDDVIVGAPYFDDDYTDEGRAYLYLSDGTGLSAAPAWWDDGGQEEALFGFSVAGAGNVDGDDHADVIIGAPLFDNGEGNEGLAYAYYGIDDAPPLPQDPDWTGERDHTGGRFGWSVACVGCAADEVDCGYDGVIIGEPFYDGDQQYEGRAYVYKGGPGGLQLTPACTKEGNQTAAYFGYSVGGAGDLDGNGYGDFIVGAKYHNAVNVDEGRAYIYYCLPVIDPHFSEAYFHDLNPAGNKVLVCPEADASSIIVSIRSETNEPVRNAPVTAHLTDDGSVSLCEPLEAVTDTNGVAELLIYAGIDREAIAECCTVRTMITCLGDTIPWKGTGGAGEDTSAWVSPDLNGDGTVNLSDLIIFATDYADSICRSDFDGDGSVDSDDEVIINAHSNHSCEPLAGLHVDLPREDTDGALRQNIPNPFNPVTQIGFTIVKPGRVSLRVYDVAGRRVRTIFDGVRDARDYTVTWDGHSDEGSIVPPGVYFYVLQAPGYTSMRKMIFLQ
jgi:hypothetical protein